MPLPPIRVPTYYADLAGIAVNVVYKSDNGDLADGQRANYPRK
jgi:hypothetical protein